MELDELFAQIKKLPAHARDRIGAQLTEIVLRELVALVPADPQAAKPRRARRARQDGASGGGRRHNPAPNQKFISWWDSDERSPADIAAQLGVSKPALYQWRSGRTRPAKDKRAKLEKLSGGAVPAASWE